MIKSIINNKTTSAAGIEDGVVSVLDTGMMEVGGGECSCVKGGAIDGLVFAFCSLIDYSIIDIEVTDVFGGMWSIIWTNKDEGVVAGVPRVEAHPFTSWMTSVFHVFCLGRGMGDLCWGGDIVKEGRWRGVD